MPDVTSYTRPITADQASRLRTLLVSRGFEFMDKPYCVFAASGQKVNVSVYEKGPKILVQGKGTPAFIEFILEPEILGIAEIGYEEVVNPDMFSPHIGVDESGKGDFFGPLVIAGAYVDENVARKLRDLGVMDSKRIGSDARIFALADQMRGVRGLVHETIVISPSRYNEMYATFGNLNKLLAWGHAKIIEVLLERVPGCPRALSDQFANPKILQAALRSRGKSILLEQRTKAESDPAVAAASIFAREGFVRWLDQTGARLGLPLQKGVSSLVKTSAANLIRRDGADVLPTVAKMHFRTAQEVLALAT